MKRPLTTLPWLLAVVALVSMLVYGFWPEPVEVDLGHVTRGSLEVTVNDDGETRIREKYVVSTSVAGELLRIQLHSGDMVEQDVTELARIEPNSPPLLDARTRAESEARLQAAEAAFHQAEAKLRQVNEVMQLADHEYVRAKGLLAKNAISQSEYDSTEHRQHIAQADVRTAEFGVKVAEFELEHARAAVTRYDENGQDDSRPSVRFVSPINGRVLRVFLEDAGAVTAATPLLELGDPQDLEIEIDVLSTDAVRIQPGSAVYIEHWGGPQTLHGVVRTIEPSAFLKVSALGVEEKRVNIIADFTDPWASRQTLGDGFRIEARIVVATTPDDSLKVPAGALFRIGESWHVYRVINGVAELCPVEIGESNGLETEIRRGLSEEDVVILHPTTKVQIGVHVIENK